MKYDRIDPLFIKTTSDFIRRLMTISNDIGLGILFGRLVNKKKIEEKVIKTLTPVFNRYFEKSVSASNKIVKKEVADLVDDYRVPMKYNKDLINKINDVSIFTGYYDNKYKGLYTKSEINRLKKVILSAKYSEWTEEQLVAAIKNTIKTTNNRALLIARTETQRLHETTMKVYYEKKKVSDEYDRVWITKGDGKVRPSHRKMNGKKAEEDGRFLSPDVGYINGPGSGPSEFAMGCRCKTELVKKEDI